MAVGLCQKAAFVWYLFLAIAAHKFVISFCIGVQGGRSGDSRDFDNLGISGLN